VAHQGNNVIYEVGDLISVDKLHSASGRPCRKTAKGEWEEYGVYPGADIVRGDLGLIVDIAYLIQANNFGEPFRRTERKQVIVLFAGFIRAVDIIWLKLERKHGTIQNTNSASQTSV